VSRTVIKGAYAQLFAEEWIEGRHGSGTYVANGAQPGHAQRQQAPGSGQAAPQAAGTAPDAGRLAAGPYAEITPAPGAPPVIDLRPGIPWTAGIDRVAWRAAGVQPPGTAADPAGIPALRGALSAYLRRARGIQCSPDQIEITRGVAGGLSLIAATVLRSGDRVGVEEPGYPVARAVLAAHGLHAMPYPADADGLIVDQLPAGLKLIYTSPAHQYPLGGRLPVPRRRALIAWARANKALIAEDDYDGEFHYDVAPLPALCGLDPEVIIYLGSTTKTLTPALRVAAHPSLTARLTWAAGQLGGWAGEPEQHAALTMITTGDMERHIRRMRHEYARRRAAVTAAFADGRTGRLLGDQAGLHVVLRTRYNADTLAGTARRNGVAVGTLTRFHAGPVPIGGLVIGYGGAPLPDVARGCRTLREILTVTDGRAPA
jgi:GntR family transcriptional regulator / MocR family aminotransferase